MKKIFVLLTFIFIMGAAFAAQAQVTGQIGSIKDVDFGNFTYQTTVGDAANPQTFKLADGKTEADGMIYEMFGKPIYADLNGDKSEDAIVEIKLSGGSYRAFEVQVFTFQKGAAKMSARLDSERVLKDYRKFYPKTDLHYAGINPPTFKNGIITIEALTEGSFACPKYTAVFNYKFSAGKFILSGKPTRKNFNCNG